MPIIKQQPAMWVDRKDRQFAAKTYETCPMCGAVLMHSNATGVDVCEEACGYIIYPDRRNP